MMVTDVTSEGLRQRRPCAAEALAAEHGEFLPIPLACDHRLQDSRAAETQCIGDDGRELDVRLQNRLNTLQVLHDLARQLLRCPRQIAHLPESVRVAICPGSGHVLGSELINSAR
jgi:hypothetical protein